MPRTKTGLWVYRCDALNCADTLSSVLEVAKGDDCSTGRGTVVHDQADADAHARSLGWQLTHGGRQVFCPSCTGRAAA